MAARQVAQEQVLHAVRVLVLVDEQVLEALGPLVAHAGLALEDQDDLEQQVVEVERVGALHGRRVVARDAREHLALDAVPFVGDLEHELAAGTERQVPGAVLLAADLGADPARLEARRVEARAGDELLQEAVAVARVVDREVARVAREHLDLAPQEPRAGRVEGRDPTAGRVDEARHARAHLARRLVRERDRQDAARRHAALEDQPRDAPGDHARLARARAGQDRERAVAVQHGPALGRVQALDQLDQRAPAGLAPVVGSTRIARDARLVRRARLPAVVVPRLGQRGRVRAARLAVGAGRVGVAGLVAAGRRPGVHGK